MSNFEIQVTDGWMDINVEVFARTPSGHLHVHVQMGHTWIIVSDSIDIEQISMTHVTLD